MRFEIKPKTTNSEGNSPISNDKLAIIKTLNSKTRLEALLLLFIYRKLSLTNISEILHKSKNTIIYHMRLLNEQGLITELTEKEEHSIKPIKYFVLHPEFHKKLYEPFEKLDKSSTADILNYSKTIFKYNILLFETIREFLHQLGEFYNQNQQQIHSSEEALQFHQTHQVPRDLIPLSEQAFQQYRKDYAELMKKTLSNIDKEKLEDTHVIHPYLAFNTVIPLKTLFEFRTSKLEKK
ncbi:MAG: helix-turn-helix domain-containing protein [Candidatus Lokiarchaeota archaeon]|nr:helix-turn-helix domain-containing protein [Candidatus Harpocratesius repetitus]